MLFYELLQYLGYIKINIWIMICLVMFSENKGNSMILCFYLINLRLFICILLIFNNDIKYRLWKIIYSSNT